MTRHEAQIRNHNIMRLRAMYATANNIMDSDLSEDVKKSVDEQLRRMGAETQSNRTIEFFRARISMKRKSS